MRFGKEIQIWTQPSLFLNGVAGKIRVGLMNGYKLPITRSIDNLHLTDRVGMVVFNTRAESHLCSGLRSGGRFHGKALEYVPRLTDMSALSFNLIKHYTESSLLGQYPL